MRKIQLKDAKTNLSAVVDQATRGKLVSHHPARQARGGYSWLCRLAAVIPRTVLRPTSDVGTAWIGGSSGAQPRADARYQSVKRFLVDTNVISATAPTTAIRRSELIEWMDTHSPDLFLSAVTIAELADGIAKTKRDGTNRRASALSAWLRTVLHLYGDRVLPFDNPTAEIAGTLADLARGRGYPPGFADIAIAATASSGTT